MAKHDWEALQAAYLAAQAKTGISVQRWCEQQGLNYPTARRHIKSRKTAQKSAVESAHSAQKKRPKSVQSAQSTATAQSDAPRDDGDEEPPTHDAVADEERVADAKPNSGRARSGRFTRGNRHSTGNVGNPHPVGAFTPGNQLARKHGAYAKYLDADDLFDDAAGANLQDELLFTRARALSVTRTLRKIHDDLLAAEALSERIALYDQLLKADLALDKSIARIESLENSLSRLRLDAINGPRFTADMHRIRAATAKLKAETQKLTAKGQGVTTPLSDAVKEVRDAGQDGVL
ncbi:terminase [Yersinia mollaretii]|uniref:terminase n=1 Tax=Yersinia mollaretii TaxID=33060 RepID=UPI00119DA419|nr:terminase [Yersinia mollaretii]